MLIGAFHALISRLRKGFEKTKHLLLQYLQYKRVEITSQTASQATEGQRQGYLKLLWGAFDIRVLGNRDEGRKTMLRYFSFGGYGLVLVDNAFGGVKSGGGEWGVDGRRYKCSFLEQDFAFESAIRFLNYDGKVEIFKKMLQMVGNCLHTYKSSSVVAKGCTLYRMGVSIVEKWSIMYAVRCTWPDVALINKLGQSISAESSVRRNLVTETAVTGFCDASGTASKDIEISEGYYMLRLIAAMEAVWDLGSFVGDLGLGPRGIVLELSFQLIKFIPWTIFFYHESLELFPGHRGSSFFSSCPLLGVPPSQGFALNPFIPMEFLGVTCHECLLRTSPLVLVIAVCFPIDLAIALQLILVENIFAINEHRICNAKYISAEL
ncbi:hypothetical protein Tco_0278279 [Tanacetum coccineum]